MLMDVHGCQWMSMDVNGCLMEFENQLTIFLGAKTMILKPSPVITLINM